MRELADDSFNMKEDRNYSSLNLDTNHGFGPIPEKRQKRAAFVSASLSFIIMVTMLGAFTKPKVELRAVETNRSTLPHSQMICEAKDEHYHVGIFIWALNLVGIILGEFMNRFCLIFEEYFHLHTRYNSSKLKMFSACFSDISLKAVLFATLVAFIIIGSTLLSQGIGYFKLEYIEIILSGIGSGSLVLYLLSLNTLSRVQISSLLENNNRLVANGLAWSFYFGYLKLILPGLTKRISETEWPWAKKLSSKKLFILMPRDCYAFGKLSDEDSAIELQEGEDDALTYEVERAGIHKRSYKNVVYSVRDETETFHVLAEYATPLCSMYDMSHSSEANLSQEDRDEQAKLFLRTLEAILDNPAEPEVRNKCKLVPYGRAEGMQLSRVLAEAIKEEREHENSTHVPVCEELGESKDSSKTDD